VSLGSHVIKQFPWLMQLLRLLPPQLSRKIHPDLAVHIDMQEGFARQVWEVIAKWADTEKTEGGNIFNSMLDAEVPGSEKSVERLKVLELIELKGQEVIARRTYRQHRVAPN
jgi:hypothetical protein